MTLMNILHRRQSLSMSPLQVHFLCRSMFDMHVNVGTPWVPMLHIAERHDPPLLALYETIEELERILEFTPLMLDDPRRHDVTVLLSKEDEGIADAIGTFSVDHRGNTSGLITNFESGITARATMVVAEQESIRKAIRQRAAAFKLR